MAVQMVSNTLPLVESPSRGVGCINDLCYRDQAIFLIMKNRQPFQNICKKSFSKKMERKANQNPIFQCNLLWLWNVKPAWTARFSMHHPHTR